MERTDRVKGEDGFVCVALDGLVVAVQRKRKDRLQCGAAEFEYLGSTN